MKARLIPATILATAVTAAAGMQPSVAQSAGQSGFFCDTSSGTPVTLYQNRQGGVEPWIRWTSDYFSGSGYTPVQRCQEVSGRLETYRRNGQLKFITVGRMNNQNVICTASQINGRCEGLIYTLKPRQDAIRTLNNFLAWREGQAGAPSLSESRQVPYIDVSSRLDGGNAPVSPAPANTQPAAPQPAQNQGGMREL